MWKDYYPVRITSSSNPTQYGQVGDALSDMLLVETALMHFDWDCDEWNASYTDFPNRLMKCQVPDRTAVQTTDAERK